MECDERSVVKTGEPVLYYLMATLAGEGPMRAFVREELQVVPPDAKRRDVVLACSWSSQRANGKPLSCIAVSAACSDDVSI